MCARVCVYISEVIHQPIHLSLPRLSCCCSSFCPQGLSSAEAGKRLEDHGRNELDKAPPTPIWRLFLAQFEDLLVILLVVACIVAGALGQYAASVVIIIIVIGNAVLGVVQEARAGNALAALENSTTELVDVMRDAQRVSVDATTIVPGDIVFLETGMKIPADLRIIKTSKLEAMEMHLTGESEPVKKDAQPMTEADTGDAKSQAPRAGPSIVISSGDETKEDAEGGDEADAAALKKAQQQLKGDLENAHNILFMGGMVLGGSGSAVVVKTGMNTQIGSIATMMMNAEETSSPLQTKLDRLGQKLGLASIFVSVLVFIIGVTTERGTDPESDQPVWLQMLLVAVSLTVAAVPEGLPACVTITLAVGMQRMSEKRAIIRNLYSVETLGSASVICSDKTGTLTAGLMTAKKVFFGGNTFHCSGIGYNPVGDIKFESKTDYAEELTDNQQFYPLQIGVLCSEAIMAKDDDGNWTAKGNHSERPLVVAAEKAGISAVQLRKKYPNIHTNNFTSSRKMMSTLVRASDDDDAPPMLSAAAGPYIACVKGAPNVILGNCTSRMTAEGKVVELDDAYRAQIMQAIDGFSDQAFRVLAFASKHLDAVPDEPEPETLEQGLIFSGLVASIDPERPQVEESIRKARGAGIRIMMITGDYVKTARAIAVKINLLRPPFGEASLDMPKITASGLLSDPGLQELKAIDPSLDIMKALCEKAMDCTIIRQMGTREQELMEATDCVNGKKWKKKAANPEQQALRDELEQLRGKIDCVTKIIDVYARAKPKDKITIVRSLMRQGHVAAMTGDGVNDGPALSQAHIGVAMGSGTEVARAASDMVLEDDDFCNIVEAIEQGRTIYNNIGKFCFFLLSTNVAEVFIILIAVIMGLQSPLLPIQILWLNLATDGFPAIALAVESIEPGVMQEGPRDQKEPLLEKVMLTGIAIQTVTLTAVLLCTYIVGLIWETDNWQGKNDNMTKDALEEGIQRAQSMTILTITFAELMRAYGARSLRRSIFTLGPFTNKYMQYAVGTSMVATLLVANIPGVMDVFSMQYLTFKEWVFVIGMSFIPITVDECTKYVYRLVGFGERLKFEDRQAAAQLVAEVEGETDPNGSTSIALSDLKLVESKE